MIDFNPIPHAMTFSAGLVSGLEFAVATWLGLAAVSYVVLLVVALARSERTHVEITTEAIELREAA
jgi:hypothetical protein